MAEQRGISGVDRLMGYSYPSTSRPRLNLNHIDGPLLTMRDGSMHWLTWGERWRVWWGKDDALTLERKYRPDLARQDYLREASKEDPR